MIGFPIAALSIATLLAAMPAAAQQVVEGQPLVDLLLANKVQWTNRNGTAADAWLEPRNVMRVDSGRFRSSGTYKVDARNAVCGSDVKPEVPHLTCFKLSTKADGSQQILFLGQVGTIALLTADARIRKQ